jgi:IMP dehydrogenase
VKRHIHGLIQDPITVPRLSPSATCSSDDRAKALRLPHLPRRRRAGKLVGLLPGSIVKERYRAKKVTEAMTPAPAHHRAETRPRHRSDQVRRQIFQRPHRHQQNARGRRQDRLRGLVTSTDVERIVSEAKSRRKPARDAAFPPRRRRRRRPVRKPDGELDRDKIVAHVGRLVDESIDCVAVSTAHGHTAGVGDMVKLIRRPSPPHHHRRQRHQRRRRRVPRRVRRQRHQDRPGPRLHLHHAHRGGRRHPAAHRAHVASKGAAAQGRAPHRRRRHHEVGRHRQGAHARRRRDLRRPVRRLPRGAGRDHRDHRQALQTIPRHGQPRRHEGRLSAARYGHDKEDKTRKIAAEGIEALKEVSGSVDDVLANLIGGVQSGMGYLGARTLAELRPRRATVRVSAAGQKEAAPHDVIEVSRKS